MSLTCTQLGSRFASIQLAFLLTIHAAHAGSATWNLDPISGDWNTASNWMQIAETNYRHVQQPARWLHNHSWHNKHQVSCQGCGGNDLTLTVVE